MSEREQSAYNRPGDRKEHQKIGEAKLTIFVGVLHDFKDGAVFDAE